MKLLSGISIFAVISLITAKEDFFTSTSYLENLLNVEAKIMDVISNYLKGEEFKLANIKWFRDQLKDLQNSTSSSRDDYVLNPLTSYLLIKRLSEDLSDLVHITDIMGNRTISEQISSQNLPLPSTRDLEGASDAILRLQDMYLLNSSEIMNMARNNSMPLTADDCYTLGLQAHNNENFNHSLQWFQEALDRLEEDSIPSIQKSQLLDLMTYAAFKNGNTSQAVYFSVELIKTNPNLQHAYDNLAVYRSLLEHNITMESEIVYDPENYLPILENYGALCRSKDNVANSQTLRCFYTHNNNSFLLLQPVKVEQFSVNPHVVMYHDVMSDAEAERLKALSKPELERARVSNLETGAHEYSGNRISKNACFDDRDYELVARMSRRAADFTGLSLRSAEVLHVINYGIGGQYDPHHDFSILEGAPEGERIATWIFYLNDIPAGGATVFPRIGVSVKPKKGSAVFWYNLYRNGTANFNTEHAGCPVLIGSKWIATKWFNEKYHEFVRPCTLNREE